MKRLIPLTLFAIMLGHAVPLSAGSSYAILQNATSSQGGYFYASNVTMSSAWTKSSPCNFLVKTHWLAFTGASASNPDWIEVGRVNGAVTSASGTATCGSSKVSNVDGYYTASGKYDSKGTLTYNEYIVTGFSTSGGHNYQIQRTGSSTGSDNWKAYVDLTVVKSYTIAQGSSIRHDIGWESNTSSSTWTTPNYTSSHQLLINGVWKAWASGTVNNNNSWKWVAAFDGSKGSGKYTR